MRDSRKIYIHKMDVPTKGSYSVCPAAIYGDPQNDDHVEFIEAKSKRALELESLINGHWESLRILLNEWSALK